MKSYKPMFAINKGKGVISQDSQWKRILNILLTTGVE
jgi:hypothetical protein